MRKQLGGFIVTVGLAIAAVVAAAPAIADNCPSPCISADAEAFNGAGSGVSDASENGAAASVSNAGGNSGPVIRRETNLAPTCTGNSAYDSGGLCGAAVNTCPVEGEIRFWKWVRTFNNATQEWGPWSFVETVCLGPDDPQIDPAVAIPGIVQRDFQRVVVLKGSADVTPKPDTLVNVATKFRTDAPASYDIPMSILGQSVVITAKAEKYTWYFGDGSSGVSYSPDGYLEHTYRKAATQQAYVVITWSGTFTVNGGAAQAINGTVTTTGNPVDVAVREARSELVRD